MISSTLPAFAKLGPKLGRAARELETLNAFLDETNRSETAAGEWGRKSAIAFGLQNIYNGIEDVLLGLANDIDDWVPTGDSSHQDLLDQMLEPIKGKRPSVLDQRLYDLLGELKNFRHMARHRYGFDLDPVRLTENLARAREAFPLFVEAVRALERVMTAPPTPADGSDEEPPVDNSFKV